MEFNEKQVIDAKDDPFWLELFLCTNIFQYKPVRVILASCLAVQISLQFLQIHISIQNPILFLQFGFCLCIKLYCIVVGMIILLQRKAMAMLWSELSSWTFDSAGKQLEEAIWRKVKLYKIFLRSLYILSAAAGVLWFVSSVNDEHLLFSVFLFGQRWPAQRWWFAKLYKIHLGVLLCCALVHPLMIIYGAQHAIIQAQLLKELFVDVTWDVDDGGCGMYDVDVQKIVLKRLEFFYRRAMHLMILSNTVNRRFIKPLFFIIAGFGYLALVGVISLLMEAADLRVVLLETDWYRWNTRNRKWLLFILSSRNKVGMQLTDRFALNYNFAIRMMRGLYSAFTFLYYCQD